MPSVLVVLLAGHALLLSVAPRAAAAASPAVVEVSVTRRPTGDLLSVTARKASLRDLLTEVARLAGFEVSEILPLTDGSVSVEFGSVPVEQGLRRLLAGHSFALVYRGTPGGPHGLSRLLLLGPDYGLSRAANGKPLAPTPESPLRGEIDDPPRILPGDVAALDPDGPLESLLSLVQHRDYRVRIVALEALSGRGDEPRAQRAILDTMLDPEPRVRNVVVGLLGSHLADWPGAEETVWSAVHDIMAPIRGIALTALWDGSSPHAHEALRLALQDVDQGVRALAQALIRPSEAPAESGGGSETPSVGIPGAASLEGMPAEVPAE
jgi:hypothetical protein